MLFLFDLFYDPIRHCTFTLQKLEVDCLSFTAMPHMFMQNRLEKIYM